MQGPETQAATEAATVQPDTGARARGPKLRRRNLSNPFGSAGGKAQTEDAMDLDVEGSGTAPSALIGAVAENGDLASAQAETVPADQSQSAAKLMAGYSDDEDEAALDDAEAWLDEEEEEEDILGEPYPTLRDDDMPAGEAAEVSLAFREPPGSPFVLEDDEEPQALPSAPGPLPPLPGEEEEPLPLAPAPLAQVDPLWERRQAILRKLEQKF